MGETLDPVTIQAFRDEIEKLAAASLLGRIGAGLATRATGFGKNVAEVGKRVINPREGFRKGMARLSPGESLRQGGKRGTELAASIEKTRKGGALRRTFGAGAHLEAPGSTLAGAGRAGGVRGVAEELSRRGWTGKSGVTKYMPVGEKGQLATVWPALSVPMVAGGHAGLGEEAGSNLGFATGALLTAGTGLPGLAATLAGGYYGGELGRKIQAARGAGTAVPQGGQT